MRRPTQHGFALPGPMRLRNWCRTARTARRIRIADTFLGFTLGRGRSANKYLFCSLLPGRICGCLKADAQAYVGDSTQTTDNRKPVCQSSEVYTVGSPTDSQRHLQHTLNALVPKTRPSSSAKRRRNTKDKMDCTLLSPSNGGALEYRAGWRGCMVLSAGGTFRPTATMVREEKVAWALRPQLTDGPLVYRSHQTGGRTIQAPGNKCNATGTTAFNWNLALGGGARLYPDLPTASSGVSGKPSVTSLLEATAFVPLLVYAAAAGWSEAVSPAAMVNLEAPTAA